MSERYAASIKIGGEIEQSDLAILLDAIAKASVCDEWGEPPFEPKSAEDLATAIRDDHLFLCDDQTRDGEFTELETACRKLGLSYTRWCEGFCAYDAVVVDWRPGMRAPLVRTGSNEGGKLYVPATRVAQALNHLESGRLSGTVLEFRDEQWTSSDVDLNAVFCGMDVTVDGNVCPRESFISDHATRYSALGCRIEVRESEHLNPWHTSCRRPREYGDNVLVNFHGQVVSLHYTPVGEHHLYFLVDLTGEPTGIRLMLPARTRLVENEAFKQLQAAMELEAYRYLQKRGHHKLPFKDYLRAQQLGVTLPEATPTYHVGLLRGDSPEPIEVEMPEGFLLEKCYRFAPDYKGRETDEANVHLLATLGKFDEPFIPVDIDPGYDGYSWARLATVGRVQVKVGKVLQEDTMWSGYLACVDSLTVIPSRQSS